MTPTTFNAAAIAQRIPLANLRDPHERRILARAIAYGLGKGWSISVWDGEEWSLKQSRDPATICTAIASTDSDTLRFRDAAGEKVGSIMLVYGNGEDVLADHTDNEAMEALFKHATGHC